MKTRYFFRHSQLPVSAHLSEHFCSACHWWLKEANDKIKFFKQVDSNWKTYLSILEPRGGDENLKKESTLDQVSICKNDGPGQPQIDETCKVEYLDMDMFIEEDQPQEDDECPVDVESSVCEDTYFVEENESFENEEYPVVEVEREHNNVDHNYSDVGILNEYLEYKSEDPTELGSENLQFSSTLPLFSGWNIQETSAECDLCGHLCETKELLLDHFAEQHDLRQQYSCESCPKLFDRM